MENVRKQRDVKLVATDKRRNQFVSEANYHTTKYFSENLLVLEMKKKKKKAETKMNKSVYLTFPILEIIKTLRQKFWYDYIKPKYLTNAKLCYMDTDGVIIQIKTEDFRKDFADDVKKLFDTTNYRKDDKIPLARGMNNKVVGLMKDELGGNIMIEFVSLKQKTYSSLMDDDKSVKRTKGTKKCVIKRRTKFNNYKDCLLNNKMVLESLQRFKTEAYCVYTEEVDKILQKN